MELSFPDPDAPSLVIPVIHIPELAAATLKDLCELCPGPAGDTIVSDTLDVHISVEGLIRDMQRSPTFNRLVSPLGATRGGRGTNETSRS